MFPVLILSLYWFQWISGVPENIVYIYFIMFRPGQDLSITNSSKEQLIVILLTPVSRAEKDDFPRLRTGAQASRWHIVSVNVTSINHCSSESKPGGHLDEVHTGKVPEETEDTAMNKRFYCRKRAVLSNLLLFGPS